MIRRHRLRKLLASTAGLRKAVGLLLLGCVAFLLGVGLSFREIIYPALRWLADKIHAGLSRIVPGEKIAFAEWAIGSIFLLMGAYFIYRGVRAVMNHILETINPGLVTGKVDVYMRRQQLAQGPRIVALGGGTGLSTLLRGLKQHSSNITAVVTVTDDGGSSGRLIQDKNMMPPGDIRNCLVALSDAEKAMTDLFQHRFRGDSGSLSGHSIGNLLIAALVDQAGGDFEKAVQIASDVLAIRGRVVPATLNHVSLRAVLEDGSEVCGETKIVASGRKIKQLFIDPEWSVAHPAAVEAIRSADIICIGPGSVYTSVLPNLLVPGVAEALKQATAPKVYICNVMTQPGESDDFSASEHVKVLFDNAGYGIFDTVVINTGIPSEQALEKYEATGAHRVDPDIDRLRALGVKVFKGNLMSESDFVRHDPMKVAERIMSVIDR